MSTTSSSIPPAASSARWSAAEALIGRVVRHAVLGELNYLLGELWSASFGLIEAADAILEVAPLDSSARAVDAASGQLLGALSALDELHLALTALCTPLSAGAR
jgi:hypothetical protein